MYIPNGYRPVQAELCNHVHFTLKIWNYVEGQSCVSRYIVNPQHVCTARVAVLGCVCVSVCYS